MNDTIQSDDLHVEIDGPVAWLRLNRPEQQNSLSFSLVEALDAELDRLLADDSVRVLVLTGEGRAFCAGVDLKDGGFDAIIGGGDDGMDLPLRVRAMMARVRTSPKPVIAALNGTTVAGGLELALACDIRLASARANIGDGHLKVGIIPGAGGAAVTPKLIGPGMAKLLLFTGALWPADRAFAAGLVEAVFPDDSFHDEVAALAARIGAYSPLGLAVTKRLVDTCMDKSIEDGLVAEMEEVVRYTRSADFAEGINAFREKRPPQFVGR